MELLLITAYHAKYFAHELSRRHSSAHSNDAWCCYEAPNAPSNTLLDQVEAHLQQQVVSTMLFTVRWAVT